MINFPFKLGVGEATAANVYGSYVYYAFGSAGGADPSIKVKTDSGDEYTLLPGQGFNLEGKNFVNLNISNAGGVAPIIGRLLLADGNFFDNRVTGSVEVIDGGKNRSAAGIAFMVAVRCTKVAGLQANAQIWNPLGSGKNVIVSSMILSATSGNTTIHGFTGNNALTTLYGTGFAKKIGMANSTAEIRTQNANNLTGNMILQADVISNTAYQFRTSEPIVVPAGCGILFKNVNTEGDVQVTVEWYEEVA